MKPTVLNLSILLLLPVLKACAAPSQNHVSAKTDLNTLATLIEGTVETPKINTENNIRDRRVRIYSPDLPGIWFYTQINTGESRKLYRQRIAQFTLSEDGHTITQTTYGLNAPEKYENAWETPELLNALTQTDFKPYFDTGCDQVWTPESDGSWTGYVDPQTCVITSKRRNHANSHRVGKLHLKRRIPHD